MPEGKKIEIKPAKGRPMLTWVGKRPLSYVTAFPAQHVETFSPSPLGGEGGGEGAIWKDWPSSYPKGGLLFHGDNKEVLAHLLANGFRGKVNLIYIDPPFDSGADYVRKVSLRGPKGTAKLDGETYTLGEQIQYTDIWANDNYLQFMYQRLMLLKELLAEDGSLWLHCDWHKSHHLRFLLDEIFGAENFRNEIVWAYPGREMHIENKFNAKHDTLLFIAKSDSTKINMNDVAIAYDRAERLKGLRRKVSKDEDGREWVWETRGQAAGQQPYKRYVDDILKEGRALNDVWDDLQFLRGNDPVRTGFPTQKPDSIIERILLACSDPDDIVLDCFIGSGTAAAVAQKLGRRWIGCDINKGAVQTTAKRLQAVIQEQIEAERNSPLTLPLTHENPPQSPFSKGGSSNDSENNIPPLAKGGEGGFEPAQTSFTVWRVNDYDLAIQHNEAVNLACEHIGVERTRTDAYFDGTLGKALVKIIPFGHPLTPLDLEELKRELEARPDEERPITLVCLGMELAAALWVEDWNKLRKGRDAVNKISVIELRTDPKYGKFMKHEPAKAKVKISRKKDKIAVEIEDFISPTIIERLTQQAGILKPKIDDWRAMVDCVMIDTAYDGKVFNVVLSDVPEKKTDLVNGSYELPTPSKETTVAVKIIDMLGEEVLFVKAV